MRIGDPPPPPPTPDVKNALLVVSDLKSAVERASRATNKVQLADALRSAKTFISHMETFIEERNDKEGNI